MGARLRILSANLWNGGADPDAFAQLVRTLDVDIAAVQELSPDQAEALAGVLEYGRLEPALDHHGMGIALRRPGKVDTLDLAYRPARTVTLEPEHWPELSRPAEIINAHIAAPHSFPQWQIALARRRQVQGLLEHLERGAPGRRALVGDLNATPLWPAYRSLCTRLEDAALIVAQREGRQPQRTWGPRPGSPRLLRIDHALVDGFSVEDFRVHAIAGSDHSAIAIDLNVD